MTVNVSDFAPEIGESKTVVLTDVTRVLKRYLWLLVSLSLGFAIAVYIWSKQQPKQYDATAMVQIDQHGALSLGSISVSDEYELKISTQMIGLQSRDVAMDVIRRLKLHQNPLFNRALPNYTNLDDPVARNALVGQFEGSLDVERVPKSELISVTFRSRSPALSALVANTTVDSYLEQNFRRRYAGSKEISVWLTRELDDLKARVQTEQTDLLNLEAKIGILRSTPTTDSSVFESELEDLLSESIRAQTAKFMAEAQYMELANDTTGGIPPTSVPGAQAISVLNVQLAQLETQEAGLEEHYGPNYGPLKQVQNQIVSLKQNIADQHQKMLESAHEQAVAAEQTQASVDAKIDTVKAEALGMNPETVHYKVLKSQYLADETLYDGLLGTLSTGGIQAAFKTQEVNRMSAADVPTIPSAPRVLLNTVAAFAIGLLLAGAFILIKVAVSDTVETVEQVEESLKLPVLAAVPMYKLDAAPLPGAALTLIALTAPKSAGAEAYRLLRTSVALVPAGNEARVVGITSCGPAEGKSTTIMNLAVVVSQQNKRVLLVDADMRKPNLSNWVKTRSNDQPGLSRYLSDASIQPEDCIQEVPSLPGMKVISVGAIPPFPSELLGQGRLDDLIAWARLNFDLVLIDTPPALLVTDALIVAQSVDILLVVARVGVAQRRALRRLQKELSKFPGKHLGTVVNAVPHSESFYSGYGGKYGYGYFAKDGK